MVCAPPGLELGFCSGCCYDEAESHGSRLFQNHKVCCGREKPLAVRLPSAMDRTGAGKSAPETSPCSLRDKTRGSSQSSMAQLICGSQLREICAQLLCARQEQPSQPAESSAARRVMRPHKASSSSRCSRIEPGGSRVNSNVPHGFLPHHSSSLSKTRTPGLVERKPWLPPILQPQGGLRKRGTLGCEIASYCGQGLGWQECTRNISMRLERQNERKLSVLTCSGKLVHKGCGMLLKCPNTVLITFEAERGKGPSVCYV
ncbi:hypothetical protein L345_02093, partial [Ophiophagus hannah]